MANGQIQKPQDDEFVGHFASHIVGLRFRFRLNDDVQRTVFTSFAMSVDGRWFLVMAGHCIQLVEDMRAAGYEHRCELVDCFGKSAQFDEPIPFEFNETTAFRLFRNEDYDYGLVSLPFNTVELLHSNGIVPFDETAWDHEHETAKTYCMLGIPEGLTDFQKYQSAIPVVLLSVCELAEGEEPYEKKDGPMFYGRVVSGLPSIKGMSGGPILAFGKNNNGEEKYWLHAMQSGWYPHIREIYACLMLPIGRYIRQRLMEMEEELANEN